MIFYEPHFSIINLPFWVKQNSLANSLAWDKDLYQDSGKCGKEGRLIEMQWIYNGLNGGNFCTFIWTFSAA